MLNKKPNSAALALVASLGFAALPAGAADLVLDRNLFKVKHSRIGKTRVPWTLLAGEQVFRNPSFTVGSD